MKTNYEVALEVIKGSWGAGDARKEKLENAGYDYYTIQNIVNSILNGTYVEEKKPLKVIFDSEKHSKIEVTIVWKLSTLVNGMG